MSLPVLSVRFKRLLDSDRSRYFFWVTHRFMLKPRLTNHLGQFPPFYKQNVDVWFAFFSIILHCFLFSILSPWQGRGMFSGVFRRFSGSFAARFSPSNSGIVRVSQLFANLRFRSKLKGCPVFRTFFFPLSEISPVARTLISENPGRFKSVCVLLDLPSQQFQLYPIHPGAPWKIISTSKSPNSESAECMHCCLSHWLPRASAR